MDYYSYQHVEKLGSDETDGIMFGSVYVFPKIDGSNSHIWHDGTKLCYGSRKRELTLEEDNNGFMAYASQLAYKWHDLLYILPPNAHIFGEWLISHSLKTYRDDTWRRFYIFDIVIDGRHMKYPDYQPLLEKVGVDYIPPIRIINNPQLDNIMPILNENTFLIKDGEGIGEGVVLKNYDFVNKYGRQTWAKVVTSEFKEKHNKEMGAPVSNGTDYVEEKIVEDFLSNAMIDKVHAKIAIEGWNSKKIPQLLGIVWHDFITETIWDALKKHKNPRIDFKILNRFVINKIKHNKPELF